MFETLHHVEVALRSAIDAQFEPDLASAELPAMWLCDPTILNEGSLQLVDETIARIKQERHTPTRSRVVAGLTFGFWRALFDKRYDRLWGAYTRRFRTAQVVRSKSPSNTGWLKEILGENSPSLDSR
jgi:hypothetical protein